MTVDIFFTTPVFGPVEFLTAHEVWILITEVEVIVRQSDILRKVIQTLLIVELVREVVV